MALLDVPGQQHAARQLAGALKNDRAAHAYLFVGPAGVGRLQLARELAAVLLCQGGTRKGVEACGACRSCRLFARAGHPDYDEIGVPEGKQDIPIDLIRRIQDVASLKPVEGDRRVFVVGDAERMSPEAFNCFLKTLEEPLGLCIFILLAVSVRELPPTVASRCQVIRLRNLPAQQVQGDLVRDGLPEEDAWWLARRSWGSPGLARRLREEELHTFNRELVEDLSRLDLNDNFRLTGWLLDEASKRADSRAAARLALMELLECAAVFYRDLAVAAAGAQEVGLSNRRLPSSTERTASVDQLASLIERAEAVLEAIRRVGANANQALALENMFTLLALE